MSDDKRKPAACAGRDSDDDDGGVRRALITLAAVVAIAAGAIAALTLIEPHVWPRQEVAAGDVARPQRTQNQFSRQAH